MFKGCLPARYAFKSQTHCWIVVEDKQSACRRRLTIAFQEVYKLDVKYRHAVPEINLYASNMRLAALIAAFASFFVEAEFLLTRGFEYAFDAS